MSSDLLNFSFCESFIPSVCFLNIATNCCSYWSSSGFSLPSR
nr:MAG TPA: hypothetical protein [Caudoviricetes sp.]